MIEICRPLQEAAAEDVSPTSRLLLKCESFVVSFGHLPPPGALVEASGRATEHIRADGSAGLRAADVMVPVPSRSAEPLRLTSLRCDDDYSVGTAHTVHGRLGGIL